MSDQMKPTNRLRFVERVEMQWGDERTYNVRKMSALQQWWESPFPETTGEWRDIPVEAEDE